MIKRRHRRLFLTIDSATRESKIIKKLSTPPLQILLPIPRAKLTLLKSLNVSLIFMVRLPGEKTTAHDESGHMLRLGRYLRVLREDLGMSLRTAAKLSGFSPAHLSKVENGVIFKTIGLEFLMRLSQTYNIPLSSVLEESGFINPSAGNLPDFVQYLRSKYNLPAQAIRDLETAKEIVERKYRKHENSQLGLFS